MSDRQDRLQDEFGQILRRVHKTVVLVTHDLDEAIRLGDRIAIMKSGKIVQYDTPDAVLSHPADAFVENFVGKRPRDQTAQPVHCKRCDGHCTPRTDASTVAPTSSLRDALALMVAANSDVLAVFTTSGSVKGQLPRDAIFSV